MKTNCAFSIKTACAEARRKEHGPPSNDDPVIPSLLVVLRNTGFGKIVREGPSHHSDQPVSWHRPCRKSLKQKR